MSDKVLTFEITEPMYHSLPNSTKDNEPLARAGGHGAMLPGPGVVIDYFTEHTYLHVTQLIAPMGQTSLPRSKSIPSRILRIK